jgi:quinol monooxygenase YgiN
MATNDKFCTIVPYFKVHSGKMQEVTALCEQFVELSQKEPGCLFYGFSFDGDQMHCREGYRDVMAPSRIYRTSEGSCRSC